MDNELVFDNNWKRKKKEQDPWNIIFQNTDKDKELKEEIHTMLMDTLI